MADRNKLAQALVGPTDFTGQSVPGMFDMKALAEKEALNRYGKATEHNGNADAFRHLVWSGMMSNKFGNLLPQALGATHEFVEVGQPQAENNMDTTNNQYGRYIGNDAKDLQQIMDRAKLLIDYKIAPTLSNTQNNY